MVRTFHFLCIRKNRHKLSFSGHTLFKFYFHASPLYLYLVIQFVSLGGVSPGCKLILCNLRLNLGLMNMTFEDKNLRNKLKKHWNYLVWVNQRTSSGISSDIEVILWNITENMRNLSFLKIFLIRHCRTNSENYPT